MRRIFFILGGLIYTLVLPAQDGTIINSEANHSQSTRQADRDPVPDTGIYSDVSASDTLLPTSGTSHTDTIFLQPDQASAYIDSLLKDNKLWRTGKDSMRNALERLVNHYHEPVDSVITRLMKYNFDSLTFEQTDIIQNDTLPLRWLNDSTFFVDTIALPREPVLLQRTITRGAIDTTVFAFADSMHLLKRMVDSMMMVTDTVITTSIDTTFLSSRGIQLHQVSKQEVTPPLFPSGSRKTARMLPDSAGMVISEAWEVRVASGDTPFFIVPGAHLPDSLDAAIQTLRNYTHRRDSILIYINDMKGGKTPFWLTAGDSELYRFWIKNYKNDSITVWMGNPVRDEITLFLEEEVNIDRLEIEPAAEIPVARIKPKRTLVNVEPLKVIPVYWEYDFSSAFSFNQTYLSNWSKGGENSVATMLDIKGQAKYTDKETKIEWTNNGRLKYGSIITEEYGLRTNTDQLELNSQFNKVIKDKVDFSSVFYMKNQLARGYNYPNDSVPVSKFLNPGTFTLGVGFEYKPFKKTEINYSPLSYKNTFVLDTTRIDQTIHGIDEDKKLRQEMGGQLVIKNKISILDDLEINNSLRLFSNYFDNPLNVDVDWEVNLEKRINWYFTVNLNLHMIYDDDIRFPVYDDNDQPVKLPDGSTKKVPKLQFKEFVGLTFSFKF